MMKNMPKINFAVPDVGEDECSAMKSVVESRWLTNGPVVREFESQIATICNASKAVAFDSCTAAMEMTLRILGIGPGDEVITTPYTYSATAEVIRNVGAKIVFVDLDGESFEMDYEKVADAITPKTKAIMPVDIGGKLCDYDAIIKVALSKKYMFYPKNGLQRFIGRVAIIADAAHSFGATLNGKMCGEIADFTCFSFHVLKNITTGGEGGAVVWNRNLAEFDGMLESTFRLLGDHGQTSRDKSNGWEYDIKLFGYNSIMTNIDAAMGIRQLKRLPEITERRKEVTLRYDSLFNTSKTLKPLISHFGANYDSAMHLYPVRLNSEAVLEAERHGEKALEEWRTGVYQKMLKAGVPCNVHYKPLPMMTAYKNAGYDIKDYPNAYKMFATLLTIPYHTELTAEQQEYIFNQLEKAVAE